VAQPDDRQQDLVLCFQAKVRSTPNGALSIGPIEPLLLRRRILGQDRGEQRLELGQAEAGRRLEEGLILAEVMGS
jgi:hypothetical protein